jgi:hypothetical protein
LFEDFTDIGRQFVAKMSGGGGNFDEMAVTLELGFEAVGALVSDGIMEARFVLFTIGIGAGCGDEAGREHSFQERVAYFRGVCGFWGRFFFALK